MVEDAVASWGLGFELSEMEESWLPLSQEEYDEDAPKRCQRLAQNLRDLLDVGKERLERKLPLLDGARLRRQLDHHTRFFRFLDQHLHTLQFLSIRVPDSALRRWEDTQLALREAALSLQTRSLPKGVRMERILQKWTEWEEDFGRCQALLTSVERSLAGALAPSGPDLKDLLSVLDLNVHHLTGTLEAGHWLQTAGCAQVGVACRDLEARWVDLKQRLKRQKADVERKRKLSNSFTHDSNALEKWMGEARQMMDRWSLLVLSPPADVEGRREEFWRFVVLVKEMGVQSVLKMAIVGTGERLFQATGADKINPEEEVSPCDLADVSRRLSRLERDWSTLVADFPVVQRALHEWWMGSMSQEESLRELRIWLGDSESRLTEQRPHVDPNSCTAHELRHLLNYYKEFHVEVLAHQATLDHASQPQENCDTKERQRGHCYDNWLAEELGSLTSRWVTMKTTLNIQIVKLEDDLRLRTEDQEQLEHIEAWTAEQKETLDLARTPSSRTELWRHLDKDLEEEIQTRLTALHELGERHIRRGGEGGGAFSRHIARSEEVLLELARQNGAVTRHLIATEQLWQNVDSKLDEMTQRRMETCHASGLLGGPALSLPAHRDRQRQLQYLLDNMMTWESEWELLGQTFSALKERVDVGVANALARRLNAQTHSWLVLRSRLQHRLRRGFALQTRWELHADRVSVLRERAMALESDAASLLCGDRDPDDLNRRVDRLDDDLCRIQTLQDGADALRHDLMEASRWPGDSLAPPAAAIVQSESTSLSGAVLRLAHALDRRRRELQEELEKLREASTLLDTLESTLGGWMERLERRESAAERLEIASCRQGDLLEPCALTADLDLLNELSRRLNLSEGDARRLHRLNRLWGGATARAQEACSELQAEVSRHQTFQQKCDHWMSFLQRTEERLAAEVAGSYLGLRRQLRDHELFQAEMSIGQQILQALVTDALHLLNRGDVDDRSDFLLKLTQLRERWRDAEQRAERRRSLVEALLRQWQRYGDGLAKLGRFLAYVRHLLPGDDPAPAATLRRSLLLLRGGEMLFRRNESTFVHTLELGRRLFPAAEDGVRAQLAALRDEWDDLRRELDRQLQLTQTVVQNWDHCEAGLEEKMQQLEDMKARLQHVGGDQENRGGPDEDPEAWTDGPIRLNTGETDLNRYVTADDVLLLEEDVQHLRCHWEELCIKVSLRKQEIDDRLNAWLVFKEKNAELCDWLARVENKMAEATHLSIEEMVEKLRKDCVEKMNLFSENKNHLKQLGEQIIDAGDKSKERDVNDAICHIDERWRHLFQHVQARVLKLKETLTTVRQLDENMSILRTWLAHAEARLAQPLLYRVCHVDEIRDKLREHQDLQRDIDEHAATVASAVRSCEVLLADPDACVGPSERDSMEQTAGALDRRWRDICAASVERRMSIEETRRLWRDFLDDSAHLDDWLEAAEATAANPDSADVLYAVAKEELKKFEAFQREVHERLTHLELVNKQYRRLARENRTDAAGELRLKVKRGNRRCDDLGRRAAAILRRLKHLTSRREDFEATREGLLMWLTEMDLQLTDVEHFSESHWEDKIRQLQAFRREIALNADKLDALVVFGEDLIPKSAPLDAALIEDELEELHSYCREVFGRLARFHRRLLYRRPVDESSDAEDLPRVGGAVSLWSDSFEEDAGEERVWGQFPPERRPSVGDHIPLEWDHTVDVGGSSSHQDAFGAFSGNIGAKAVGATPPRHRPASPPRTALSLEACRTSFYRHGYVKLMSECGGSIDHVKRVKSILNDEQKAEGLTGGTELKRTGTGVIERWEVAAGAQTDSREAAGQDQRGRLDDDLRDVTSWLDGKLPELEALCKIPPSARLKDFEDDVGRLKVAQKAFCDRKRVMISVNLASRRFLLAVGRDDRSGALKAALGSANHAWMRACGALESWEAGLRTALLRCQEFHESLHALILWLAQVEQKLSAGEEPRASLSYAALLEQRHDLEALREELRARQATAAELRDLGGRPLPETRRDPVDCVETREKVHAVANKMKLLLRQIGQQLEDLDRDLRCRKGDEDAGPADEGEAASPERSSVSSAAPVPSPADGAPVRRSLLARALRAAFPLHVLLLLLLVLACCSVAPQEHASRGCSLANNFARSLHPVLRYTNGPPPT
ncbi:nesprin-2-like isoform X2 [Stigmatopora argus]